MKNADVFLGAARFEDCHDVAQATRTRCGRNKIFIKGGGRAYVPPLCGIAQHPLLTKATMMEVDFLPRHPFIVGGSYVRMEFGKCSAFRLRVTRGRKKGLAMMSREDEDVSDEIANLQARAYKFVGKRQLLSTKACEAG